MHGVHCVRKHIMDALERKLRSGRRPINRIFIVVFSEMLSDHMQGLRKKLK